MLQRMQRAAPPCRAALGSLWTVLAWAALLAAIVVSFRPAVPVIWGDTPSFVESAFRTLEAGRPTVVGGRDPGYPAFLAVTLAFGGDLATVVRVQQAAWAVLMLALAATAQGATRNAGGLVPIILVATYPGLLLFRNVLTAELLFAVFLNLAMAGLLVATWAGKTARCCAGRSLHPVRRARSVLQIAGYAGPDRRRPDGCQPCAAGHVHAPCRDCRVRRGGAGAPRPPVHGSRLPIPTRPRSCSSPRHCSAIT